MTYGVNALIYIKKMKLNFGRCMTETLENHDNKCTFLRNKRNPICSINTGQIKTS